MPEYTKDWFSHNKESLKQALNPYVGIDDLKCLEIGVFEGRSTNWLLDNIFTGNNISYTCLDTFEGSKEEADMDGEYDGLQDRFLSNIAHQRERVNIEVIKDKSLNGLINLSNEGKSFDFIYVDGSHTADNVMLDAILSFRVLDIGAAIVFDDYRWYDPYRGHQFTRPKIAIDAFANMYEGCLKLILRGYQVGFCKVRDEEWMNNVQDWGGKDRLI